MARVDDPENQRPRAAAPAAARLLATAASYKVLGVGIVHGRLPAALAGEGSAKKDKEKHELGRMKQLEEWPPPVRGVRPEPMRPNYDSSPPASEWLALT